MWQEVLRFMEGKGQKVDDGYENALPNLSSPSYRVFCANRIYLYATTVAYQKQTLC